MSRPIVMSFRPDALDLCLDGRKTQTRRLWKDNWSKLENARTIEDTSWWKPRAIWTIGDLIGLKRSRTGKVEALVRCTGLRIEHTQDITEADAIAEGMTPLVDVHTAHGAPPMYGDGIYAHATARDAYEAAWRRLYPRGPHSWEQNPMVVVISFEVAE